MADITNIPVNVILTFDNERITAGARLASGQAFLDLEVSFEKTTADGLDAIEIDVLSQIIKFAEDQCGELDDLVKISLCYGYESVGDAEIDAVLDFLCRFRAKYYFQPNQRDPHEQAIVDATGIASKTLPVDTPATA